MDYLWIVKIVDMLKLFIRKNTLNLYNDWIKVILFESLKFEAHGWYFLFARISSVIYVETNLDIQQEQHGEC